MIVVQKPRKGVVSVDELIIQAAGDDDLRGGRNLFDFLTNELELPFGWVIAKLIQLALEDEIPSWVSF